MDTALNYCPRCGEDDIDRTSHGDPDTGICRGCGTMFTVLMAPTLNPKWWRPAKRKPARSAKS